MGKSGEGERRGRKMPRFDYMDWLKAEPAHIRRMMTEPWEDVAARLATLPMLTLKLEVPRIIEACEPSTPPESKALPIGTDLIPPPVR